MGAQGGQIDLDVGALGLLAEFNQWLAEEVDHRAVTGVLDLIAVDTDSVDRGHIGQILDRAGP